MRVLFVANAWPTAEQPWRGVFIERQGTGLQAAGVEVDVLPIHGHMSRVDYARAAARVLSLNFSRRRYDVLHAHTGHCGVLAMLQVRHPVVMSYVGYDVHGGWENPGRHVTRIATGIFRQLSRVFAATIIKSERDRALLPAAGLRRNHLLPNGVDFDEFRPLPREEARRRLGWKPDGKVVLFPSDRGRYTKRFELAWEAFTFAKRLQPALELVTAERVLPTEMPLWLNAADVLILTSRVEGSPNAVKEAMACNLPIVSVDVGDVAEITNGTRHCHICHPDAETLARAICSVVDALPERSDGRERISHLALASTTHTLIEIYGQARGRGPGALGFLNGGRFSSRSALPAAD